MNNLTDEQIIEVADRHLYKGYLVFAKEIIDEFCRLNGIGPLPFKPTNELLANMLEAFNSAEFDTNISRMRAAYMVIMSSAPNEAEVLRLNGGGGEDRDAFAEFKTWWDNEGRHKANSDSETAAWLGWYSALLRDAPQPQQAAPIQERCQHGVRWENRCNTCDDLQQAAHMQATGPLHVVCQCDACKASPQAALGDVVEGWQPIEKQRGNP